MIPQFRIMQESVDWVNRVLREQITGIRVVRAFVREDHERARFAEANTQYTGTALAVGRLMALVFPIVMLIFNASTVAVLWFGSHRVANGDMQIGELTAFMSYLMQILMSVMMATFMSMMIPRATVSAGRIAEVLDTDSTVVPPPAARRHPARSAAGLELTDVTFAYPGADVPVLQGVSLVAEPGRTTAIIGSTGAGKSTLLSLVPRLYDVTGGQVLIGGVDVRDAALDDVWARIGLVPQKPYLFTGTVATNLRYGDAARHRRRAVGGAADRPGRGLRPGHAAGAGLADRPGRHERLGRPATAPGHRPGAGRQARRSTSSTTPSRPWTCPPTRGCVRRCKPVTRHAAVIVVAQRVSTIVDADQIVVLDDGRVVGTGTHDELLDTCPTYVEIVQSQQSAQEVAA